MGAFSGQTAIVTGAAAGVGRATAERVLDEGGEVMLADTAHEALDHAYDELSEDHGARVARFPYELDDKLCVANLIAATLDAFDDLDVLVTDVRVSQPGSFLDLSPTDFAAVLMQNVHSTFLLCQQVARTMIQRKTTSRDTRGAMVVVSSIAAERTVDELLSYSVSCAAMDQLVRSMAASLAPERIRVNTVALGSVMTGTLRDALREREGLRDEMVQVTPLGRIGESDEAAEATVFLASRRASFITGQTLRVDGGRTILDPLASPIR